MIGFDFNIIFDQSHGPYTPGQLVTGKIGLFLKSSKAITRIKIKFEGRADVAWSERKRIKDGDSHKTVWHRSHELYFKTKLVLFERQGNTKLHSGQHLFPFAVLLPKNIPSSFSGAHGTISYFAIAKVLVSGEFDRAKKEFFNVKNFLNLNCFPSLKTAIEVNTTQKFYVLCCISCGKLTVSACIPRSGFVSNETIPLILEINNESTVSMRKITAYVVQKIEWRAQQHRNYSRKVLKSFSLGSICSNSSATIIENVPIPEKDYPYLENCHIILLRHELKIEVDPGAGHCDLDVSIPITVGDIAFMQDETNHGDDHFLLSLDNDDAQVSESDEKSKKPEIIATYKPNDNRVEIFSSQKY